jgi:hypothetical protein
LKANDPNAFWPTRARFVLRFAGPLRAFLSMAAHTAPAARPGPQFPPNVFRKLPLALRFGPLSQGKTCAAIVGITDGRAEIMEEYKGFPALDAGLLAAAQAVEHYEISRYGKLIAWAEELGLDDAIPLLQETLEEEKATDEALTDIAKTAINQEAEAA